MAQRRLAVGRDGRRIHLHAREGRGAARGERLAERVPVVDRGDARGVGGDREGHPLDAVDGLATGGEVDPVGVERAGRVVLRAVEDPAAVALLERRGDVGQRVAGLLARGVADDGARRDAADPLLARGPGWPAQHELDVAEVAAEQVPDVRVGGRQLDHELRELGDRRAAPAVRDGQADRSEARLAEERDGVEGERAVALAGDGARADPLEQREELGAQVGGGRGRRRPDVGRRHENAPRYAAAGCDSGRRSRPVSLCRSVPGSYSRCCRPRSWSTGVTWSTKSS